MVIESPWDVVSLVVGVLSLGHSIYQVASTASGWGDLGMDAFGAVVDAAAVAVPGVIGGVGVAIQASRPRPAAQRVVQVGQRANVAINTFQAARAGVHAYQAYQQQDSVVAILPKSW